MSNKYQPSEFEKKWLEKWKKEKLYNFKQDSKKKKFYNLVELPYTSGDLHIGHWFAFTIPDVLARFKRMNGFNVFFPNGYDAFGLPAENAAIKRKIHPKDWTMKNIENMTKQYATMGTMIDWNTLVITCLPEYYRWNQWIFLKMYEKGLAYRGKALSNWCENDQTVIANENIEAGKCWRCGKQVVQKEVEQWFLKITDYADKLIWPASAKASAGKPKIDWPTSVRVGQNNWIGKSEGMLINFDEIEVFTTRPETTDGATFMVLAPENPLVKKFTIQEKKSEVNQYLKSAKAKTEMERKENREKTGIFTGSYVTNPVTGKKIPVWVGDYVLYGYGTGALMAVPAEDERDKEFAQKFNLPIIKTSLKANPVGKKKTIYHIRDWSVSRQRYWGTPVPMIHCQKCGIVAVPEKDLPVELPYKVDFTPKGKPPLASNEQWLRVRCPKCNGKAKRDAETLDTFFDSAWYWFRYLSPHYDKGPFDKEVAQKLTPVDVYFGGSEHTLGHTLYARFFTKFFKDLGLIDYDEFALKRIQHGVVLGPDGNRMSKSKGNVINPDDIVNEYGADTIRMYLSFLMPYDATGPWSTTTINGVYRFLNRVWKIFQSYNNSATQFLSHESLPAKTRALESEKIAFASLISKLYKTIEKVSNDIEQVKLNTAIAAMMEFINEWESVINDKSQMTNVKSNSKSKDQNNLTIKQFNNVLSIKHAQDFLKVLAPFAPFITEEIWREVLGEKDSIHLSIWPKVDPDLIGVNEEITIPVQVNGKLRATIIVQSSKCKVQSYVVEQAIKEEKVKKYLERKKYKVIYVKGKIINFII